MAKPKKKQQAVEDIDDLVVTTDLIFAMLHGDHFWHGRIRRLFAAAGIRTRRLEREEAHPIWQAWLTLETFALSPDRKTASQQLRKILRDGGLKIGCDEFNLIDRRGDKLRCVFLLNLGAPGVA